MPKVKPEEVKPEEVVEVPKKYFIRDSADRFFTEAIHGFDLKLVAGEKVEVSKEVADLAKEKFSYLEVIEA